MGLIQKINPIVKIKDNNFIVYFLLSSKLYRTSKEFYDLSHNEIIKINKCHNTKLTINYKNSEI